MKRLGFDRYTGSVAKACTDLIRRCCSGPGLSVSFSLSQSASRNTTQVIRKSFFRLCTLEIFIITTKRNISESHL